MTAITAATNNPKKVFETLFYTNWARYGCVSQPALKNVLAPSDQIDVTDNINVCAGVCSVKRDRFGVNIPTVLLLRCGDDRGVTGVRCRVRSSRLVSC